jgi:predicted dehydrogenase
MNAVAKLGVGVIGLGVGEQLAAAFDRHPDCRLAALCDLDQARLLEVGAKFPAAKRYMSAEELIDDSALQIVVVASYDDHHGGQILRALRANRHVFSEKPMCLTEADAAAIRKALADAPGLRLSSNTILRMSPRFLNLRHKILSGSMGKLFYAEGDYNYGRLQKLSQGWRGRIPNYSVMLGGGIHMVDLLLWLMGTTAVEVSAYGNGIASRSERSPFEGHDLAVALVRFADGAVAKVAANFGCVFPHFHRLLLYGTEGTYENAVPDALWYKSRDPAVAPNRITDAYPGMGKGDLVPSFVDAIMGRGRAVVEEQDIFAGLSVCFAINRSLASGRPEAVIPI